MRRILEERGVKELVEPSPSVIAPLLSAAVNEDRDILKSLWARLLANACDPNRQNLVRLSFIVSNFSRKWTLSMPLFLS